MTHADQGVESAPRAVIVSIGDELLLGQTLDTNSRWLSGRLADLGVAVVEHVTVGDDLDAMVGVLRRLTVSPGRVDVILLTGGLGPTADDLTRDALAGLLGEQLIEDDGALEHLRRWYAGRDMPPTNLVQARRPESAVCLPNPHGTAPGLRGVVRTPAGEIGVYCLPGPPREMQPMFEAHVAPRLRRASGPTIVTRVLPCFGLGESEIARRLGDLMDRDRAARGLPLVGTTASQGVVSIRVRAVGEVGAARAAADAAASESRRRVGEEWIIADREVSLAERVLELLRARGQTLAVAESCTGGLLGSMLTDIPGSSDMFVGGWITYANAMKTNQIGVPAATIERHGAVSQECAVAMAEGALRASGTSHALAITGIAGPGGGSADKPVGTVWVALASSPVPATSGASPSPTTLLPTGSTSVPCTPTLARRFKLVGDRANIRTWAAQSALGLLRLLLIDREDLALMRQVE